MASPVPSPSLSSDSLSIPDGELPDEDGPLRDIENPRLLEDLAEQSLRHYKVQHGVGLGKVFKKILNGIGVATVEPTPVPIKKQVLASDEVSPFIHLPVFKPSLFKETFKETVPSLPLEPLAPESVEVKILHQRISQAARQLKEIALNQAGKR